MTSRVESKNCCRPFPA